MLKTLTIQNFALIKSERIVFPSGFLAITGETGAGKSIMLKALALCLGGRAEDNIKSGDKTFLELEVTISEKLKPVFESLEIPWQPETTITRTLENAKSRSYINDEPISLKVLKKITPHLLLLHTQTSQGLLEDEDFRYSFIDLWAESLEVLKSYQQDFEHYQQAQSNHKQLLKNHEEALVQKSFWEHQIGLFDDFDWSTDYEELKEEQKNEATKKERQVAFEKLGEWFETLELLRTARNNFDKIEPESEISKRLEFIDIEMEDIAYECSKKANEDQSYSDPAERARKLKNLSVLEFEFRLDGVEALRVVFQELEEKLERFDQFEFEKTNSEKRLKEALEQVQKSSDLLKEKRSSVFESLNEKIKKGLNSLGMEHAQWECRLVERENFDLQGKHDIEFFFQANKDHPLLPISAVASGGEKARVMLVIQDLWSQRADIPTIIFDEIDTGVSGHIAEKMGFMMREISSRAQVMTITHLPQVASLGVFHWHIIKTHGERTTTSLNVLEHEQRIKVLAQMMSGEKVSPEAIDQARSMLEDSV